MILFGRLIAEATLQWLIDDQITEQYTLDYKEYLPVKETVEKGATEKFLDDVVAFANRDGGHIIYGMTEKNGKPQAIVGLKNFNPEQEKMRLERLAATHITPSIPLLQFHEVPTKQGPVFVLHVRQSWNPPHMVTFNEVNRFMVRGATGNIRMQMDEIREQVLRSSGIESDIDKFRMARMAKIVAGDTPRPINTDEPMLVVHLVPYRSLRSRTKMDPSQLRAIADPVLQNEFRFGGRVNTEGYVLHAGQPKSHRYVQLFRNGIVEFVLCEFSHSGGGSMGHGSPVIYSDGLAILSKMSLDHGFNVQRGLGVEPPIAVLFALIGVRGYEIPPSGPYFNPRNEPQTFDRPDLFLDPDIIEAYPADTEPVAVRALNDIWYAAGWGSGFNRAIPKG